MSLYSLLVTLHVASVIVWLGAGSTLVFVTIYARRARDGAVLAQLAALTWWMSLWVMAPSSIAAAALGIEAAEVGHWPKLLFFHVGEGAFAFSFLLTVAVRLPLLHRARRGAVDPIRLSQYLLALAVAELTVLYLAVASMVVKPTDVSSSAVRYGGVVLALGFSTAAALAYRGRRVGGRTLHAALRPIRAAEAEAHHLHAIEQEGESAETPYIAIAGLALFVLLPVYLVMLGIAFAAYYLA
jgi:uncharacterized membrane protein